MLHNLTFDGLTAAVMMTGLVWILHLSNAECLCLFYFQRRCYLMDRMDQTKVHKVVKTVP